ncbi:MAG: TolC family protein [Bdellovibrionales bacterium]|nr:TolC family protein [Bdellovibrionales bacterium]
MFLIVFLFFFQLESSSTTKGSQIGITQKVSSKKIKEENLQTIELKKKKTKLYLSEKDFLKRFLSSSPHIKKIKLSVQSSKAKILGEKYSLSEGFLISKWNYDNKKNPFIDRFIPKKNEIYNKSIAFQKKIPYGFSFNSFYFDRVEESSNSEILNQFRPESIYRRNLSLELKANLTETVSHFWLFDIFKTSLSLQDLRYQEESEGVLLKALSQYWKTYLAYVGLKQAEESLKTYKKLVQQINDKKRYNFLQPGERPQILAEYQNIQNLLDVARQNYDLETKALFIYLNEDSQNYDFVFKPNSSFVLPQFKNISLEETRFVQMQKKKIETQKLNLLFQKTSLFPSLELVGKRAWIPASMTREELNFSSDQSVYGLEISLKWSLFSKSFYQRVDQKKYELEESKIDFEILKKEQKNQMSLLQQKIKTAHKNIQRTKQANRYRQEAFKELQKSFNQGRVDIFQLIQAEKEVRDSEIKKIMALSEYSISLASLLSLRDELLERYLK